MNQTLNNLGKVSDKIPYIREARSKLEIRCIYLTLAEHTATQIWDRLERCRSTLIRELGPSGITVTGLFLSNENTIGPAVDLLTLVLREASRDRR